MGHGSWRVPNAGYVVDAGESGDRALVRADRREIALMTPVRPRESVEPLRVPCPSPDGSVCGAGHGDLPDEDQDGGAV
ncbi:hypothetical protein GCM10010253_63540 [Streptomyces badius]|uniref:Uncharacterized protein n=1 Tax=Streptomyces badius TaxID=1941 RepID=A0ABQ2TNC5_STRBA|nr:hypothetical protein GCM10010253_63540 [Streptomyces badius]